MSQALSSPGLVLVNYITATESKQGQRTWELEEVWLMGQGLGFVFSTRGRVAEGAEPVLSMAETTSA